MKRKAKIVCLILTVALMFTGCLNYKNKVTKRNIKTSYPEWVNEIGLLDGDDLLVYTYIERDDGLIEIEVDFIYDKEEQSFQKLSEIIDKSNEFVKNNPDYFPPEAYVCIGFQPSFGYAVCFFSKSSEFSGQHVTGSDVGLSDDMTIKFAAVNMKDSYKWITDYNVNYNVPVVVLCCEGAGPTESYYSILNHFNGLEQVLLKYQTDDEYFKRGKDHAQKYAPGVDVYKYTEDKKWVLIE